MLIPERFHTLIRLLPKASSLSCLLYTPGLLIINWSKRAMSHLYLFILSPVANFSSSKLTLRMSGCQNTCKSITQALLRSKDFYRFKCSLVWRRSFFFWFHTNLRMLNCYNLKRKCCYFQKPQCTSFKYQSQFLETSHSKTLAHCWFHDLPNISAFVFCKFYLDKLWP